MGRSKLQEGGQNNVAEPFSYMFLLFKYYDFNTFVHNNMKPILIQHDLIFQFWCRLYGHKYKMSYTVSENCRGVWLQMKKSLITAYNGYGYDTLFFQMYFNIHSIKQKAKCISRQRLIQIFELYWINEGTQDDLAVLTMWWALCSRFLDILVTSVFTLFSIHFVSFPSKRSLLAV